MSNDDQGNSIPEGQQQAEESVFDSGSNFFDDLEQSVNGVIAQDGESTQQATQETRSDSGPIFQPKKTKETHDTSQGPNNVDWEKRYKDSSKEAVKMATTLNQLKPFVPVLEAMKRDSGLVDHVRDYLKGGGSPDKSIKEKLKLDEDFEFDPQEAISDPESDSAKLQNAHIDQLVQSRVGNILNREKKNATMQQKMFVQKKQEVDFVKKHGMTNEEFAQFKNLAKQRSLSLDDVYYLLNKDKAATNVANNTKQDMLNQMKNVRNIPTSASDSNNQGSSEKSPEDRLFEGMLNVDGGVDDLFG
jgi:hypothetical protein